MCSGEVSDHFPLGWHGKNRVNKLVLGTVANKLLTCLVLLHWWIKLKQANMFLAHVFLYRLSTFYLNLHQVFAQIFMALTLFGYSDIWWIAMTLSALHQLIWRLMLWCIGRKLANIVMLKPSKELVALIKLEDYPDKCCCTFQQSSELLVKPGCSDAVEND